MPIGTKKAPSARTVGDFRQLLVFLHISHPPAVYILVLEVQCCLHTRPSSVTVVFVLWDSAWAHISTQQAPSGTPLPELERISVSHWRFCKSRIHLRFTYWCWQCGVVCTDGPPVCLGWLRDSAPMPISTQQAPMQCPNYRGFPSVTGMSACLESTCALHTGAGSVAFSAQAPRWCAWGV